MRLLAFVAPGANCTLLLRIQRPYSIQPTAELTTLFFSQDLARLKHQQLTSPTAVLEVDFLKTGVDLMAPSEISSEHTGPHMSSTTTRLPVKRSGRADAVAVWFDLWLDGERGERDFVSTRPEQKFYGDASGWVSWKFQREGLRFTADSLLSACARDSSARTAATFPDLPGRSLLRLKFEMFVMECNHEI